MVMRPCNHCSHNSKPQKNSQKHNNNNDMRKIKSKLKLKKKPYYMKKSKEKNEVIGTQIENNKVYNDNLTHLKCFA